MSRRAALMIAFAIGCGVRAPSRIDIDAMLRASGEANARQDLAARIASDPKDIAARLGLAALEDRAKRPSAAIEQLDAVAKLSGPIGTRWHADDRARLARLLAARSRARLAREAHTALPDLQRAAELGAAIDAKELTRARALVAIARLRHVDAKERAAGMRGLAELWMRGGMEPAWAGARRDASAAEHGAFGVWLWKQGAKRAAWEQLSAWHGDGKRPRDAALAAAYLTARAWWVPADGPAPEPDDLIGPARCRYARECAATFVVASGDDATREAIMLAPATRGTTDVEAWMAITLEDALRGGGSWGPMLAARVDLSRVAIDSLPAWLRPTFATLAGHPPPAEPAELPRTLPQRLLVSAGRALRGASADDVEAPLRDPTLGANELMPALLRVMRADAQPIDRPLAAALAAHVRVRVPAGLDVDTIRRLAEAYRHEPLIAERLGRVAVASAVDAGPAHASLGAMFDALGDPARARIEWQAAVDVSPEPIHQQGLAEAIARAKDPDAALVAAVTAAAAAGDPAVVWVRVARGLEQTGEHVHALDAARSAIGLASGQPLLDAYDIAIDASRALGRTRQVDELERARAKLTPPLLERPADPTDAAAALAEYRRTPTAASAARLWVATRWNPHDVALRAALLAAIGPDDPRRGVIVWELVEIAGDPDVVAGREAVAALARSN